MVDIRKHTAYHEAGHAIVANALGSEVLKVTCEPVGPLLGESTYTHSLGTDNDAAITMAGFMAENRLVSSFDGDAKIEARLESGFGALKDIDNLFTSAEAEGLSSESIKIRMDAAIATVESIFAKKWAVVESLAQELLEKSALDATMVKRIIEDTDSHW